MNDQENSQLEWEETGLPSRIEGEKKRLCSAFSIPTPRRPWGFPAVWIRPIFSMRP